MYMQYDLKKSSLKNNILNIFTSLVNLITESANGNDLGENKNNKQTNEEVYTIL